MDDRQTEGDRPARDGIPGGDDTAPAAGGAPAPGGEHPWELPDYLHERELGAGASGRVVLARHRETGTPVAIKYLRASAGTPALRAEAQVLARIDSPHVTRLYEYVEGERGSAIVMELVDGIALRELLRAEGATTAEAALVVLKGSLLGLAAAHAAGVVHRDYKPANVLVDTTATSKLVDFGIAVASGDDRDVSGTPAYMPPEQWAGRPASPAGDVYAATVTFFECLTGARPYAGTTIAELAVQHTEAPIPAELAPDPVRPLILAGLAKDPQARPDGAAAFVEELEAVAAAGYGPQWEEKGRRDLTALVALLALLLPGAQGGATGGTSLAHTALGGADGFSGFSGTEISAVPAADTLPATAQRTLTRRGARLGTRGKALVGVAAGAVTLATLAGVAMAGAADGGARTVVGGASPEATTSLAAHDQAGPSPTPSSADSPGPTPSASADPTATAPTTPGTPSGSASAAPTGKTAPAPGAPSAVPATGPAPAPPGPAGAPSAPPAAPAPTQAGPSPVASPSTPSPTVAPATITVSTVNLDSLVCGGRWSLTATVTVAAQGAATGTLTLSWYHSSGGRAVTVATDTVAVQNGRATITRTHDFGSADTFPTWGVRIGTTPAAAQPGRTSAEMNAFLCNPPR
ncbi:protein kinase [Kitasatospora sp. NPDC018058]|uniref:protein kinase domain-containing protein n=1 Tax=Kitasatospora sp. NPDC018058 TaxID=3364025 RepID=UPI0037BE565C